MEPDTTDVDPGGQSPLPAQQEDGGGRPEDHGTSADSDGEGPPGASLARPWSLGSRIAIAGAIAVVSVAVAVHLGMVFLHVAPANTVSRHSDAVIDDYIYPEFEQNWKLFAPNPLQQNIAVHARALVERSGGERITTGWVDLTSQDGEAIKHNPAPSHSDQNMLRRAWDFYIGSHDEKDKPFGERGEISREYVRRIVAHRFGPRLNDGRVVKIQVRSATTSVAAPAWSKEVVNTSTAYRVVPWWTVTEEDFR